MYCLAEVGQVFVGEAEGGAVHLDHRLLDVELAEPQGRVPVAEEGLDGGLVRAFGGVVVSGDAGGDGDDGFLVEASFEAEPSMVKAQSRVKTLSCHCLNKGVVLYQNTGCWKTITSWSASSACSAATSI